MLFNSLLFLCFLAAVLAMHQLRIGWQARKAILLIASYVFYAAWNPPFVALLWLSTLVDWWVARALPGAKSKRRKRGLVAVSLCVNLGLLAYFKYSGFAVESLQGLLAQLGASFKPAAPSVVLPVGISFYTFQTLSYTFDVYRGRLQPRASLLDFALFVSFFPQLVAGPIVRAGDFLPQCETPQRTTWTNLNFGLLLLLFGLFEKIVLADTFLAPASDRLFAAKGALATSSAWLGVVAFSGQIFCDFAGYSLCAIGVAGMLGFRLPDNFHAPYAAIGFSDFWARWHISLSTWLRDYLYISLGGNRAGRWRTLRNLAITMLLGGLWHGASWNFVLWGALHGTLLIIERVLREQFGALRIWRTLPAQLAFGALTLVCVVLCWVPFRAHNFEQSGRVFSALFGFAGGATHHTQLDTLAVPTIFGAIVAVHWLSRAHRTKEALARVPVPIRVLAVAVAMFSLFMIRSDEQAFLYFQF